MAEPRPRRLTHPSPPGSLLKRFTPPVVRMRTIEGERDADYLALVRQCPCLKCGMEPSEAAHVRFASAAFGKASGLGKKPNDSAAVPLCAGCHRLDRDAQHARGEREFWAALNINPLLVAQKLYAVRSDLLAMKMIVVQAIAERSHAGGTHAEF